MKFFNRVRVFTGTTGTGDTIALGSSFDDNAYTLLEAGGTAGDQTAIVAEQADGFAIYVVTVGSGATSVDIDSVIGSKISGTAGVARISLDGTAVVRFVETAEDFNAILASLSDIADVIASLGDAAFKDTGTTAGTVAAGDDSRFDWAATALGGKMDTTWTLTAAGLATGGGTGAANRTITVPGATQANMEAQASGVAVTPDVAKYAPSAAKAWGHANTTGTLVVGIGISSITDNAVGHVTYNWAASFSSANYVVNVGAFTSGAITAIPFVTAAGSAQIAAVNIGTTPVNTDPTNGYFASALGDL